VALSRQEAPPEPTDRPTLTRTRARREPGPGSPAGTRSRRVRWVAVLAALLAVAGLGALAAVYLLPRHGTGSWRAGHAPATHGTAAARPPVPTPAPPTTGGASATGTGLPQGWHRYRDYTGFSVAVPDGWTTYRRGSIVYFRDPNGSRLLGVDQTGQPQPDPVADWTGKEGYRVAHGDFPGYQRIRIAPVDYFTKAADWEFTYTSRGRRVHVVNRGVITSPHQAYGFWWQTPDSDWAANLANFRIVTTSFQPRAA
jgi:eukaryotic-like serine/threonine-protein kinase